MHRLFWSPGSCSFAPHVFIEEIGLPYESHRVSIRAGENETEGYLRIHPLARVPALQLPEGEVVWENLAVLGYLVDVAPAAFRPASAAEAAEERRWLSVGATWLHGAFQRIFRPAWFTTDPSAHAGLATRAKSEIARVLALVDAQLQSRTWIAGDRYGAADPLLFIMVGWAADRGIDLSAWSGIAGWRERMLHRPAVRRVLAEERLDTPEGRAEARPPGLAPR
jgi:glutathione S-transferase